MTDKNALKRTAIIIKQCFEENLDKIPKKTGNLRYNATKLKQRKRKVSITIDQQIAPYADRVNTVGKSKGYWDRFTTGFQKDLIRKLYIESEELNKW